MHKTFKIDEFKKDFNNRLANSNYTQDEKKLLSSILEQYLFNTGNYRGFNYVAWMNGGYEKWIEAGSPTKNTEFLGEEYSRYYY